MCPARWLSGTGQPRTSLKPCCLQAWASISRWQRDGLRDRELMMREKGGQVDEGKLEQVAGGEREVVERIPFSTEKH